MKKPDSLRAFLSTALPELAREPERLDIFIDKGRLRSGGMRSGDRPSLAYEIQYKLTVLLTDFSRPSECVLVPLLAWVTANQPELLLNPDQNRQGIAYEADVLDGDKIDLQIELELSERVRVSTRPGGGYDVTYLDEPALDPGFGPWPDEQPDPVNLAKVFLGGDQIAPEA